MTATVDIPTFLFALARESTGLLRHVRQRHPFPNAPVRACLASLGPSDFLLVEFGVGMKRCQRALDWVLNDAILDATRYLPNPVVSCGFSGALHDELRVGDLICASHILDEAGHCWASTLPWKLDEVPGGRILCTTRLIAEPAEKQVLAAKYEALAVDMETAAIARTCTGNKVPFGCIRAISDAADTRLSPKLISLISSGRVSPWKLLVELCRSPSLLPQLLSLAKNTRLASDRLGDGLKVLLRSS